MSRLAREYPEATYDELFDLGLQGSVSFTENEPRYEYDCRSCNEKMWVGQDTYDYYEANRQSGKGFTSPKCRWCI